MFRAIANGTTWALVVALFIQFYAAGLGIIGGMGMRMHAGIGWLIVLLSLIRFIAVASSRPSAWALWSSAAVAGLMILQPVLIFVVRARWPSVAALHAVTGVAALTLLLGALAERKGRVATGALSQ